MSGFRDELPDGSRIERDYKLDGERAVAYGSWYWRVYDPDRRPKRKRVNLRTKDKAAAMRKAMGLARDRSLGTFDPWGDAAPKAASLEKAAEAYALSQQAAGRAESTVASASRMLDAFARSLPSGCHVGHVEPSHVEAFVNAPKVRVDGTVIGPKSAGTRRRYRAVLRHFFGFCIGEGFTRIDPTAGMEAPKGRTNRREHITEAEAADMPRKLDAAEVLDGQSYRWLRDWIVVGLGTGLRPGEQASLRWADVRLAEGVIRVRGTKTDGSSRPVPFAGDAADVLQRRADERTGEGGGYVFTGARGGKVEMRHLSKRIASLAETAEVPKHVTAYCLRHSYGTRMAAAGVPLLDLARIMGTGVQMIERHYGHYCPERGSSHVARVFGVAEPEPESEESAPEGAD